MARILSVSYDEELLYTRRLLLESRGYSVTSALELKESLYWCEQGGFDLFILGHSIPETHKQSLIESFRASCRGTIISLICGTEPEVKGADYYIDANPEGVLNLVAAILSTAKPRRAQSATAQSQVSSQKVPRNRA
jgi:CheY-like chemotaxis protein